MMSEITILSGKGGTGKTSVTAALASVAKDAVYCDCDVDASDLHLLLSPQVKESHDFSSGLKAVIDPEQCISCGICADACRFSAISQPKEGLFVVDPYSCEGCRLCERICPTDAIHSVENKNNAWYVSETRFGPMVHARMGPGEENSGKLVTTVRNKAKEIAKSRQANCILNDGPPGIGCPVIASLTGVKKVLLVVEPSKTGIHDIKRLVELTRKFSIPAYAIINKQDLNPEMTKLAVQVLAGFDIPVLGKLDFDERFTKAMIEGKTIVEYAPVSSISQTIKWIYKKLLAE
jgi:MinD superfamily P-loop ATPase